MVEEILYHGTASEEIIVAKILLIISHCLGNQNDDQVKFDMCGLGGFESHSSHATLCHKVI